MAVIERVNSSGDYGDAVIVGADRNSDVGLQIEVPDGELVELDTVTISNCFVGLIHKSGSLHIRSLEIFEFGGDAINLLSSNVKIDKLVIHSNTPTRPYNQYHQDAIQAYAIDGRFRPDPNGSINNIYLPDVQIAMSGETSQGIAGTETCEYDSWFVGDERLHIDVEYYYAMMFVTLKNSVIGGEDVAVNKPIRIQNVKQSEHGTDSVYLVNINEGVSVFDSGVVECGKVQFSGVVPESVGDDANTDSDELIFLNDEEMQAANELLQLN